MDWCWDCAGSTCRGPRSDAKTADDEARQVTVFGIIATPGSKTADTNLTTIKAQLDKLLPKHGFRLLDAQSKRIVAGESVTCDLSNGYTVVISLVQAVDEDGKVQIRCELFQDQDRQFSTAGQDSAESTFLLPAGPPRRIAIVDRSGSALGARRPRRRVRH